MGQDILIRDHKKGDEGGLVKLLNPFFENISSINEWENFYQKGAGGAAAISVAEYLPDNKVFGHYAVLNTPMVIFGDKCMGGKGEGSVVDRAFVKKILQKGVKIETPILTDLIKHAVADAVQSGALIICSNPNNLALKAHMETGHAILNHRFDIFVLALKRRYLTHLISKKIKYQPAAAVLSFILFAAMSGLYHFKKIFSRKCSIRLAPFDLFDNTTDLVVEEFCKTYNCITMQRDREYLNKRFSSKEYKKFMVKIDEKVMGYVVMRVFVNKNGFKEALLLDYVLRPPCRDAFKDVIFEIVDVSKRYGCDILRVNYLHDLKDSFGIDNVLRKLYFLGRPDQRNLVIYLSPSLTGERSKILNINNWFFTDLYFEMS